MALHARRVDLDRERGELLGILERNLLDVPHAQRLDWLYRLNPAGPAWSWFACEGGTGRPVGVATVFPRRMWLGRKLETCGQVADFAVEKEFRSLGPAVVLQRATLSLVEEGAVAFCYDCPPHDQGMSTFRRLGIEPNTRMWRYARPLRSRRHVEERLGRGPWSTGLAVMLDRALELRTRMRNRSDLEIAPFAGDFDGEFSELDSRVGGRESTIRSCRKAEELNWRYRKNPVCRYEVFTARRRGELKGFAVFSTAGSNATVADVFADDPVAVGAPLLDALARHVRTSSDAASLQTNLGEPAGDELGAMLSNAGFWRRDPGERIVAVARNSSETAAFLQAAPLWLLQQVDVTA